MENLTKHFRLTCESFFVIPGNKSKYVLLGGNKMVRNVLQGMIPIYEPLIGVKREILGYFKLT